MRTYLYIQNARSVCTLSATASRSYFHIFFLLFILSRGLVREFSSNAGNICIRVNKHGPTLSVYVWYGCKCIYEKRTNAYADSPTHSRLVNCKIASSAHSKIIPASRKLSRWHLIVLVYYLLFWPYCWNVFIVSMHFGTTWPCDARDCNFAHVDCFLG